LTYGSYSSRKRAIVALALFQNSAEIHIVAYCCITKRYYKYFSFFFCLNKKEQISSEVCAVTWGAFKNKTTTGEQGSRGMLYTYMADLRCMAETNTTLESNFPLIKNKIKKKT